MFKKTKKLPLLLTMLFMASLSIPAMADSKLGKISGYKFHDLNGNGIDDMEPRLAGVTITVTSKTGTYEETDVTDENGRFSFRNIPRGKYEVCETVPENYTATTPECVNVTLRGKAPHVKVRFGNKEIPPSPLGQIIGLKFNDINGNEIQDAGEAGLAGWTITINGITNPSFEATTTTDSEGRYEFLNLPLGNYQVCEVVQSGWIATTPVCVERELTETVLSRRAIFGNQVEEAGGEGCTLTQGFWKSKAGETRMEQLIPVGGLLLGTTAYTVAQLQSILDQPVVGNMLINLAHQLIAAKFNVLNGADDTAVAATITHADGLIGSLVVPPVGTDEVTNPEDAVLYAQMETDKTILDNYNMGLIGPGHCGDNTSDSK